MGPHARGETVHLPDGSWVGPGSPLLREAPFPGPSCISRGDLSLWEAVPVSLLSEGWWAGSVQGRSQPRKGLKIHPFESPKRLWGLGLGAAQQTGAIQEGFVEEVTHKPGLLRGRSGDWREAQEEDVWGSGCNFFYTILDFYKF